MRAVLDDHEFRELSLVCRLPHPLLLVGSVSRTINYEYRTPEGKVLQSQKNFVTTVNGMRGTACTPSSFHRVDSRASYFLFQ